MSEKLDWLTAKVRMLIEARANRPMSEAELRLQTDSFIVGNAFDVFKDADTITAATLLQSRQLRLQLAPAGHGQDPS